MCSFDGTIRMLHDVFILARLVSRSRAQQRKCDAARVRLEAFQTRWTLNFAVHMPPVRPSAVRLQPLAPRPLMQSVEPVWLGKDRLSVSHPVCVLSYLSVC